MANKEVQIQTTKTYHFIPTRMARIKTTKQIQRLEAPWYSTCLAYARPWAPFPAPRKKEKKERGKERRKERGREGGRKEEKKQKIRLYHVLVRTCKNGTLLHYSWEGKMVRPLWKKNW
jgi:hypothetical protein